MEELEESKDGERRGEERMDGGEDSEADLGTPWEERKELEELLEKRLEKGFLEHGERNW